MCFIFLISHPSVPALTFILFGTLVFLRERLYSHSPPCYCILSTLLILFHSNFLSPYLIPHDTDTAIFHLPISIQFPTSIPPHLSCLTHCVSKISCMNPVPRYVCGAQLWSCSIFFNFFFLHFLFSVESRRFQRGWNPML